MPDRTIEPQDALQLIDRQESQLWEQKSASARGAAIQKIGVALANTDGGEFIVGIEDVRRGHGLDPWQGFSCIEAANVVHQALARDASPPLPYEVEHLEIAGEDSRGIAVLVKIEKLSDVHFTATSQAFVRRGASSNLILGQTDRRLATFKRNSPKINSFQNTRSRTLRASPSFSIFWTVLTANEPH